MTAAEFAKVIGVLQAGVDRELPSKQAAVWFRLFERFPAAAAEAAVIRYLSETKDSFLPAPGVLIQMTVEAMTGNSEEAGEAYLRLCRVRIGWGSDRGNEGEYRAKPHLGEQLWAVIESLGGWERFCGERDGSQATEWAQFRDAWAKAAHRNVLRLAVPIASQPRLANKGDLR